MRMLILGTGGMAAQHAKHFAAIEGVSVVAGVDVDPNRLEKFNTTHNIPNGFASLDAAIAWGQFDAAANVTPDSIHHATSIAALKAGKHVFCEKPLATDATKAFEMVDVAEKSGLINMVNLTYRNVAQLQKAREIVKSGAIGAVKHVESSYLQSWLVSKAWGDWRTELQWLWRLSKTARTACSEISASTSSISLRMARASRSSTCSLGSRPSTRPRATRSASTNSTPMTASPWRWISTMAPWA